jgi:hypothetical protein
MVLVGKDQCLAKFRELMNSEWGRTCQAFHDVTMGKIMPECVEECPVDTGTLQASIPECSHVTATPNVCVAVIGAGGAASAYALVQHEHLEYHHTHGKAKYIEDPVLRNAPDVPAMVAARKGQL